MIQYIPNLLDIQDGSEGEKILQKHITFITFNKKLIIIFLKQQQEKENDVLPGKWQQNDVNLDQFVQQMQFNYSKEPGQQNIFHQADCYQ